MESDMIPEQFSILVVDDIKVGREVLQGVLTRQGYQVSAAADGVQALELIRSQPFDLILLDILMPRMDGYQVLEMIKADPKLHHIPVIMISMVDETDAIIRCIELGAEDFITKPYNRVLLKARIEQYVEKKLLRDQEKILLQKLQGGQEKSEQRLLNIVPESIADRLKKGQHAILDHSPSVTVMLADFAEIDEWSSSLESNELIEFRNDKFSIFDKLASRYSLEKITTTGDSYMVIGGIPDPISNNASAIAELALDIMQTANQIRTNDGMPVSVRIGINTGPIRVGVIGNSNVSYDLWGDTVNLAGRMKSLSLPGAIQVSEATYNLLQDHYVFENRNEGVLVEGKSEMLTYVLLDRKR
jgi:adenylate cyclase